MVSVWLGTQADDAFPESCNSDAPYITYTRSKVYQSPKLWYLRASVIEAQDLRVPQPPLGSLVDLRVKIQLGFQSARTRRSISNCNTSTFSWLEDLMFVVSEPLDDQLIVLVEDRSAKDPVLLGHTVIPVATIDQRLDERHLVPFRWFNLDGSGSNGHGQGGVAYGGRIQLSDCAGMVENFVLNVDDIGSLASRYMKLKDSTMNDDHEAANCTQGVCRNA